MRREREKDGRGVSEEFEEVLEGGFEGGEGAAVGRFYCLLSGSAGKEGVSSSERK